LIGRRNSLLRRISDDPRVANGHLSRARPCTGKGWYREVLGCDAYFDEPYYVGFSVGGFELGLIPDGEPGTAGVQVYWGVSDAVAELDRLVALGAEIHEPVKDVGGGIKVASVRDPFGNLFSIIENPQFKHDEMR
jgi:predicted enzyme related to lactoylglutathione lyase